MQHAISTDDVVRIVRTLRPEPSRQRVRGVDVWRLVARAGTRALVDHSGAPHDADGVRLRWAEMRPAQPHRVRVRNASQGRRLVSLGTLLTGGMAMRAVRATQVVEAQSETVIDVEPLGGRWWDLGPLREAGAGDPLLTALLVHGLFGAGWAASSARTLVAMVSATLEGPQAAVQHLDTTRGALIADRESGTGRVRILAGWVAERALDKQSLRLEQAAAPPGHGTSLMSALIAGLDMHTISARIAAHGPWGRDVVLLPRGTELVDRLSAAA